MSFVIHSPGAGGRWLSPDGELDDVSRAQTFATEAEAVAALSAWRDRATGYARVVAAEPVVVATRGRG